MSGSVYDSKRPLVVQQTSNRMWRVWLHGQPATHALDIELSTTNKYYIHDVVEGLTADLWCDLDKEGAGVFEEFEHALAFCRLQLQRSTENRYQEIRVRLLIKGEQKGGYKLIENVAGHSYEALRHFFEDIGYEVDAVEIGEVEVSN